VNLLLHAVVLSAGIDVWNVGSYIQGHLLTTRCQLAEVRSACGGALVALDLACSYLQSHNEPAALITASDCWPAPFDRWGADSSTVFGDGAGALVLSRERGFARVRSIATTTDPELEGLHRGNERFNAFGQSLDLDRRAREFIRAMAAALGKTEGEARAEIWRRFRVGLVGAVSQATADAGVSVADVEHVVLEFAGAHYSKRLYFDPLGLDASRTTFEVGLRIGHLGAADVIVGLHQLLASGRVRPRDRVLVIGDAAGFMWSAAVLEVIADPVLADAAA
jgi:3-oxoacyl-[acyl-carrier-protein] synthase-3